MPVKQKLGDINPEAQTKRQIVFGHSLNPKVCNAKHFGEKIHYNQNEKMGMFKVIHVCSRDGFSGKIVRHATLARKNNLVLYDEVYRLIITFFIYKDDVFQISEIV